MLRFNRAILSIAAVSAALTCASAQATTITFDEFAPGNGGPVVTTLYTPLGITFGGTNAGTWGGNAAGDPGNWSVDGTNGPQFLGYNGPYAETITFSSAIISFSADFSRTEGSSDGVITLDAYSGATLVTTVSTTLGPINIWSTLALSGAGIDRIELSGAGTSFHPFAIDNIVFFDRAGAVPEPATWALMIAGFGLVGAAQRRRRTVTLSFS